MTVRFDPHWTTTTRRRSGQGSALLARLALVICTLLAIAFVGMAGVAFTSGPLYGSQSKPPVLAAIQKGVPEGSAPADRPHRLNDLNWAENRSREPISRSNVGVEGRPGRDDDSARREREVAEKHRYKPVKPAAEDMERSARSWPTRPGSGEVEALLANPNCEFSEPALVDLEAGIVDERLVATLQAICQEHEIYVGVFKTGHTFGAGFPEGPTIPASYGTGSGHPNTHYFGRAADIREVDGMPVEGNGSHPSVVDVGRTMAGLPPKKRPDVIIGPSAWNEALGYSREQGWILAPDQVARHEDHLHVGFYYGDDTPLPLFPWPPEEGSGARAATDAGPPIFHRPATASPPKVQPGALPVWPLPSGAPSTSSTPRCADLSSLPQSRRVVFPLPGRYANSYEDSWGASRPQGGHEGTDLMSPAGTPLLAVVSGTLVPIAGSNDNGWNSLGGYTVMLRADHDIGPIHKGDLFYYAHMDKKSALPIGTKVQAGQEVGTVGDTGQGPELTRGLFPPHLHLGWYDASGARTSLPSGAMNPHPLLQWLKVSGGVIAGGTKASYCEAPQKSAPSPSTGDKDWPVPEKPSVTPDLNTGDNGPKPSPVAKNKPSPTLVPELRPGSRLGRRGGSQPEREKDAQTTTRRDGQEEKYRSHPGTRETTGNSPISEKAASGETRVEDVRTEKPVKAERRPNGDQTREANPAGGRGAGESDPAQPDESFKEPEPSSEQKAQPSEEPRETRSREGAADKLSKKLIEQAAPPKQRLLERTSPEGKKEGSEEEAEPLEKEVDNPSGEIGKIDSFREGQTYEQAGETPPGQERTAPPVPMKEEEGPSETRGSDRPADRGELPKRQSSEEVDDQSSEGNTPARESDETDDDLDSGKPRN